MEPFVHSHRIFPHLFLNEMKKINWDTGKPKVTELSTDDFLLHRWRKLIEKKLPSGFY